MVLKNSTPDVKELLKALQLTIEFETQLTKRYERLVSTIQANDVFYLLNYCSSSLKMKIERFICLNLKGPSQLASTLTCTYISMQKMCKYNIKVVHLETMALTLYIGPYLL